MIRYPLVINVLMVTLWLIVAVAIVVVGGDSDEASVNDRLNQRIPHGYYDDDRDLNLYHSIKSKASSSTSTTTSTTRIQHQPMMMRWVVKLHNSISNRSSFTLESNDRGLHVRSLPFEWHSGSLLVVEISESSINQRSITRLIANFADIQRDHSLHDVRVINDQIDRNDRIDDSNSIDEILERTLSSIIHQWLSSHASVEWFERQQPRERVKRSLASTSTSTSTSISTSTTAFELPSDPLFNQQWHLLNQDQIHDGTPPPVIDSNVIGAWQNGYTGKGRVIAIVDDGIERTHPDFQRNFDITGSFNYFARIPYRTPDESHGTSAAGVAAAARNSVCGVGVAYDASLSAIALIGAPGIDDATEAEALNFAYQHNEIYSNSWGPVDDGHHLEAPGPLTREAFRHGVTKGRGGLGNIYVWASGNGANAGDECNYDGYANAIETIAVGAVDVSGKRAPYSEQCAALFIVAPSSGRNSSYAITTSELGSSCTNSFSGTSSATPVVAGVVALMLQANEKLSWRDVQHIFTQSSVKVDPENPDWITNAAGLQHSHEYGFGLVDANAAVNLAKSWQPVSPSRWFDSGTLRPNIAIPADPTPVSSVIHVRNLNASIEHVEVTVDIVHAHSSDLRITLTAPSGTVSVLSNLHGFDDGLWIHWSSSSLSGRASAAPAGFGTSWANPLIGQMALASPLLACDSVSDSVRGRIALVQRDDCAFEEKARNAARAGAIAVIVMDTRNSWDPLTMIGSSSGINIPCAMISKQDATAIKNAIAKDSVVTSDIRVSKEKAPTDVPLHNWRFSSVRHWGEMADGNWTLTVSDQWQENGTSASDTAVLRSWSIRLHGLPASEYSPEVDDSVWRIALLVYAVLMVAALVGITIHVIQRRCASNRSEEEENSDSKHRVVHDDHDEMRMSV